MAFLDRFRNKRPPQSPRGRSGRGHFNGFLVPEEQNADLIGVKGLRTFDKMYRTDPDVRRVVGMVANLVIKATWSVEPRGGDAAEEKDREAAKALHWALHEHMRPNLIGHLAQALPVAIRSGFAPFEQIWTTAEYEGKTLLVPKHLGLRLPRTIFRWYQEGEELTGIQQLPDTGGTVDIPAEDLVYYRFGAEGDNWEGTSLLRPAYKPWFYKDFLERLAGIKAEIEATGVPVLYPPKSASSEQLDEMEEALQGLRTADQAYVVMPGPKASSLSDEQKQNGWELDILHQQQMGQGGRNPILDLLEYQADKIAVAFFAEFMRLGQGTQSVGARATAAVQQDPFLAAAEALVSVVETALQESVVERFIALNFEVEEPPRLKASLIDSTSLSELADYIQKLASSKALNVDDPLEDHLRELADLPPADPEERKRAAEVREAARNQILNPPKPGDGDPPKPGDRPAPGPQPPQPQGGQQQRQRQQQRQSERRPAPAPERTERETRRAERELRWWEGVMQLERLETSINSARERFEEAGGEPARELVRELVAQGLKGREPKLTPPKELTMALGEVLGDLYETGRETVRRELEIQRKGAPAPAVSEPDDSADLSRRARLASQSIVQRIWQAISRTLLAKPGDEAAAQAAGETEAKAALRAEAQLHASAAVNGGRIDEAEAHRDEIRGARYTSILDSNRCDACAAADDDVLRPLDDPVRLSRRPPNPDCYGGGRCRCLEFYELTDEAAGYAGTGPAPSGDTNPVAQHFPVSGGDEQQQALVRELLDAIAQVHELPAGYPTVPIAIKSLPPGKLGEFSYFIDVATGQVDGGEIALSSSALRRRPPFNSTVHEIGHSLDSNGLGAGVDAALIRQGAFFSSSSEMARWRDAVESSAAYARLQQTSPGYLLKIKELFARSYEQWIALRSGNRQLRAKIAARMAQDPGAYWDDEDFEPIADALDEIFATRALRK